MKYDVAISFSRSDQWIAKDLARALGERGLKTYYSADNPNRTNGFFSKELRTIYIESSLNVMIWSSSYATKDAQSPVNLEKDALLYRHIGQRDYRSLIILDVDDYPIDSEFAMLLMHKIYDVGIFGAREFVIEQLVRIQADQMAARGSFCMHPQGSETTRNEIRPCKFQIKKSYLTDELGRWGELGDINVTLIGPEHNPKIQTYLIPSGVCPPVLAHSLILKDDRRCLAVKQYISERFATEQHGNVLVGSLFYISKYNARLPHVYSLDYDAFLINNYAEAVKEIYG